MLLNRYQGLFILLAWLFSHTAQATTLLPVDLSHLHRYAQNILYAECIDNQVEMDQQSNAVVTYTTFSVKDAIKGAPQQTITIKQIGGEMKETGAALVVPGVPKFALNEKYLLFLPKKSRLGFSSPVGLGQGSFQVFKSRDGNMMVSNGRDFSELMAGMENKPMSPVAKAVVMRVMQKKEVDKKPQTTMHLNDFINVLKDM